MRTRGSNKSPAATRPASDAKKLTESKSAAPPRRLPVFLWAPNLIGYIRVLTLIEGMRAEDPASNYALWCITTSYLLDYLDGPCARKLNQCSQFGDLLDHFTDHATNMYLVWVTSPHNTLYGRTNIGVSAIHNGVIFLYMIAKGHYMKHGSGNVVTRAIEQNNYWNVWSLLWGFNTVRRQRRSAAGDGEHIRTREWAGAGMAAPGCAAN